MNNIMKKGYGEVVPQSELQAETGKVWYLPHHGVYHPQKSMWCLTVLQHLVELL